MSVASALQLRELLTRSRGELGRLRDLRARRRWPVAGLLAVALPVVPLTPHVDASAGGTMPRATTWVTTPGAGRTSPASDSRSLGSPATMSLGNLPSFSGTAAEASSNDTPVVPATTPPSSSMVTTPLTPASRTSSVELSAPEAATPTEATTPAAPAPALATAPTTVGPDRARVRIGLRFRYVGVPDAARTMRDATRLVALPTPKAPAAVLLGAAADGRRAIFLVSDQATAWGEGDCTLQVAGCPALELGVGQTELLDLPGPDGAARRYALTVTAVERVATAGSPARTMRVRARRSTAGARVLREAIAAGSPVLDRYRWSAARGLVEEHRTTGSGD